MPTCYQILSVPETASQREIKTAFRKLSLRYHPDRNNGDKAAEARFREVLDAYKVLCDPDKKAWYDRQLFYQRQPPRPAPQPQPVQPQSSPQPQPVFRRRYYRGQYADEYVQPDFSRMPWKFMGMVTAGLIVFFVLLYNFGPKPQGVKQERPEMVRPMKIEPVSAVIEVPLKLKDGTFASVAELRARHRDADFAELLTDIDGDGENELQLSLTYPGQETFTSMDYIFRKAGKAQDAPYEEFFSHEGGTYIVGNNMRLYFDAEVENYRSCATCKVSGLPNARLVPAIYLHGSNGRLWFAETNPWRNREIAENLAYLKTAGIPELQNGRDDGTRKEYIRQIVAYYFNNRDYAAAEAMFRKYYPATDVDAVWSSAAAIIKTYQQKITSNAAFGNMEVL